MSRITQCLALTLALAAPAPAAEPIDLFNGRDLTGWVNVNCAPDTWSVRDGLIVTTGKPRGFLRTERMYENYVLELEWKHLVPKGNSGLFVHADALPQVGAPYPYAVEVQVMDGDHGSMFGIRGMTVTPLTRPRGKNRAQPEEDRAKPAGEWNHYRLTSRDGALELAVNGKVVTRLKDCSHVKGYVCLEAEGSECHFRNLKLTELPSSNPPAERVARTADGFHCSSTACRCSPAGSSSTATAATGSPATASSTTTARPRGRARTAISGPSWSTATSSYRPTGGCRRSRR
jgi:Domain of Unknown Function (DUF1080)